MRRFLALKIGIMIVMLSSAARILANGGLPDNFVYLSDVDSSIQQDIRYATAHNFIGEPVRGYQAGVCIVTRPTALALANVQRALKPMGLSLKVYDCYRPQQAVDEFVAWSHDSSRQQMKAEFYPRVNKADIIKLGYVAARSGHTRGSTVDVTLVSLPTTPAVRYTIGMPLVACFAPYKQRFHDNSIDMGTGFDCFDVLAHDDSKAVSQLAYANRKQLQAEMLRYGFVPYRSEWWHFTLKNEPYPDTYFTFPVRAKT